MNNLKVAMLQILIEETIESNLKKRTYKNHV